MTNTTKQERLERLRNNLEKTKANKSFAEMNGLDRLVDRLEDQILDIQEEIKSLEEEL